uniref:Capsid scaffolding protein n=2 Tax=Equid alphaherpesvirus 4 TaxID=10331 RepID=A0A0X8DI18_9ALPH|nr:capsid maturation protease [Equid alphaherpesvirus 4]
MDAYATDSNVVSLPIYVAGYIALYDMGDGGELTLTRETVAAALPPASRLPINIDHRNGCVVGEVLSIVDDVRGPFFLGIVNCPQLGAVLATAAGPDFFGEMSEGLSEQERLLYLVSNYLPSASLSSRRLGPDEEPDETLFAHVSLCVIGRRVGTIVTYDATPENTVAPFKRLSPSVREELLITAREAQSRLGDMATWHVSEDTLTRVLLSTAVNNMLLRNRWNLVARRRREAGIEGHTYLQASASFGITNGCNKADFCGAELVGTCGYKSGERVRDISYSRVTLGAKAFTSSGSSALPSSDNSAGQIGERAKHPGAMASSNQQTLSAAGAPLVSGDYILVPAAQYNQLVVGQHTSHPPINAGQASATHAVPTQYIQPAYNSMVPTSMYQAPTYWSVPPSTNLEAQITALVGALAADRKAAKSSDSQAVQNSQCSPPLSPQQERRYTRKRRHDWDANTRDDIEGIYYPGERSPRPVERRAGRASTTIADLMGAVSSLQQEVSQLRAIQTVTAQQQVAPAGLYKPVPPGVPQQYSQYQYIHPQHAVSAIISPQLSGIQAQPPQSVIATPVPAVETPGGAKVCAAPTATHQAVEHSKAVQPQFEAVTSAAVLPVNQPQASSQTVDASASTGLDFGRDDADIFVSQMMSAR